MVPSFRLSPAEFKFKFDSFESSGRGLGISDLALGSEQRPVSELHVGPGPESGTRGSLAGSDPLPPGPHPNVHRTVTTHGDRTVRALMMEPRPAIAP